MGRLSLLLIVHWLLELRGELTRHDQAVVMIPDRRVYLRPGDRSPAVNSGRSRSVARYAQHLGRPS